MSVIDKLKDDDLRPVMTAIDKMETALAICPRLRASQILNATERHAIATLALAMDSPNGNSTANS